MANYPKSVGDIATQNTLHPREGRSANVQNVLLTMELWKYFSFIEIMGALGALGGSKTPYGDMVGDIKKISGRSGKKLDFFSEA